MASVACSRAVPPLSMISGSRSALDAAVKLASCSVIFRGSSPALVGRCGAPYTKGYGPCMPRFDTLNSWIRLVLAGGQNEGSRIETCPSCWHRSVHRQCRASGGDEEPADVARARRLERSRHE